MTAKEWLMRAWKTDKEITALQSAREMAYERCVSITSPPKSVLIAHSGSAQADDWLSAYANYSGEIDEAVRHLVDIKREILIAIQQLQSSTYRTLLIKRYVNFETWEQIAYEMSYCYRHVVHDLHPEALRSLEHIIEYHIKT